MFAAAAKTLADLADPAVRRVMWRGVGLATLILGLLGMGLYVAVRMLAQTTIGWVDTLIELGTVAATLVLLWLLFPAVVSATVGVLLDQVAAAVEARRYPGRPAARVQPVPEMLSATLRFAGIAIALNVLALPFYLALTLVPPLNFFVFYALNGYLLGREYFELVASRRLDPRRVRELRRANSGRVFAAGVAIAVLLTVPVVNLAAPVMATAFMLHLVEGMRARLTEGT